MVTRQTKSFIVLCVLAVALTYLALLLTKKLPTNKQNIQTNQGEQVAYNPQPKPVIDSTSWSNYADPEYSISFKHPKEWLVSKSEPTYDTPWYIISLGPKDASDLIRIYINSEGYFAFDGIKTENKIIAGYTAQSAQDLLIGIKEGDNYYTFDAGIDTSLHPYFTELVKTIGLK